jgi:hypothetical protein
MRKSSGCKIFRLKREIASDMSLERALFSDKQYRTENAVKAATALRRTIA